MQAENERPMRHSETISRREWVRRTGLAAAAALLLPEANHDGTLAPTE